MVVSGHVDSSENDTTRPCDRPEETVEQGLNPEELADRSGVGAGCKDVRPRATGPDMISQGLEPPGDFEDLSSTCYLGSDSVRKQDITSSRKPNGARRILVTKGRITHRTAAMNYTPEQRWKIEEERKKKEEDERRKKEKEMAKKEAAEKKRKRKAMQEENSKSRKKLKGPEQQAEPSTKNKYWFRKLVGRPVKP